MKFPHSEDFLSEEKQKENWRRAEVLITQLQATLDAITVTPGGTPTGPAGGVLSGTYPNPGFAEDMATQAELGDGLATKAAASHAHPQSDITNLTTDLAAKAADSAVVHKTGAETIDGDKTFSNSVIVDERLNACSGMVFADANVALVSLYGDYVSITAYVGLSIAGVPVLTGYALMPNEGGAIPALISGGEILYSHLGTLYMFDANGSGKTVDLNYDVAGGGLTIIKNIGASGNITVDADPAGSYAMTSVVLTPGQYATFANHSAIDFTIHRIG